jgi:hypothetical protein
VSYSEMSAETELHYSSSHRLQTDRTYSPLRSPISLPSLMPYTRSRSLGKIANIPKHARGLLESISNVYRLE